MSECVIQGLPKSSTQEVLVDGQRFATVQRHRLGHTGPTFALPATAIAKLATLDLVECLWLDTVGNTHHRCDFDVFAKNAKPDGDGFLSLPPSLWTSETVSNQFEHVPPSAEEIETFRKWAAELGQPSEAVPIPLTEGRDEVPAIPTVPKPTVSSWKDVGTTLGPITWECQRWLARGFLHLLVGESGKGKSSLALRWAASYLLGWPWPDGSPFSGEVGAVLWCEAEGAQALNLQRAGKWGLPIDRLICPFADPLQDVNLDNPQHRAAILAAARLPDVKLVVVDSLSGACGARRDENSAGMLQVVKWLAALARDTGKPVLLTHHLRKAGMMDGESVSLDRVRGHSSVTQMCRLAWALDCPERESPERLRLSVIKSNLDRFPSPLGLSIDEHGVTFGEAPHKSPVRAGSIQAAIVECLRDGPRSTKSIALSLSKSEPNVADELKALKMKRLVAVVGRQGREVLYALREQNEGNEQNRQNVYDSVDSVDSVILSGGNDSAPGDDALLLWDGDGVPDDDSAGPPLWDDGDDLEGSGA